jgi:hypothetical protein
MRDLRFAPSELLVFPKKLFVLGEDEGSQSVGVKLLEIGQRGWGVAHQRTLHEILYRQMKMHEKTENFFAHTAICGV